MSDNPNLDIAATPAHALENLSSTAVHQTDHTLYGRVLAAAAILIMVISGLGFRWVPGQFWRFPTAGLIGIALGGAAFVWSASILRPPIRLFQPARHRGVTVAVRWGAVVLGVGLLLALAEANANWLFAWFRISHHLQALLLLSGLLSVAYALGGFSGLSLRSASKASSAVLLATVALGFILRTWQLSEAVHVFVDEIHFYDGFLHLRDDPYFPLLRHIDSLAAQTHLVPYLEQWTVALFGRDLASMRLVSAILGTLTIPAVYLLGRALADRRTGLLAAALLAVFPPHIHFSRLAIINIADPLFGTLAPALLIFALRYNRQRDYVLAGLFLGLTSYFYEGGRLLFPVLLVVWLFVVLIRHGLRQRWRSILLMLLMTVVTMMPYYYTSIRQTDGLTPRLTQQGRANELLQNLSQQPTGAVLLRHVGQSLLPAISHTIYSPDGSDFYYGGNTGILLWFLVPFFFLGLLFALFRMQAGGLLLWLWLLLALLGISLVIDADWTARFCVLFPMMMLTVAIGLRYPLEMIAANRARRWVRGLLVIAVFIIGAVEVQYYFREHLPIYNRQVRRNEWDMYDAIDRAAKLGDISRVIFVNEQGIFTHLADTIIDFYDLSLSYEVWRPSQNLADRVNALPRDHTYAFALLPHDQASLAEISSVLPLTAAAQSAYESAPLERQYALHVYSGSRADGS